MLHTCPRLYFLPIEFNYSVGFLVQSQSVTLSHAHTERFVVTDLSHTRTVQAAMIHREMLKTSSTVPGQIVMRVFITNRVLKCTCNTHTQAHTLSIVYSMGSFQPRPYFPMCLCVECSCRQPQNKLQCNHWSQCRSALNLHVSYSPAGGDSTGCKKKSVCMTVNPKMSRAQ